MRSELIRRSCLLLQAGQDMRSSEAVLPVVQRLVVVAAGARHVRFTGVVFEHGAWLAPNSNTGFVDDQVRL